MMSTSQLLKGFEVEMFTGRDTGENVGVAIDVMRDFPDFVNEPDHRNLEYITAPIADYPGLATALTEPRRRLRTWLAKRDLTLLPGSTLRRVSKYFGDLAVAHSCHAAAVHCDILRLSNRPEHGIQGVGPQWHADGTALSFA